jgi:hypothetical protein
MDAHLINPDDEGNKQHVTWESLDDLQKHVGGWIEVAHRNEDETVLVDEEGLIKGLPVNKFVSALLGQTLVGPALIVKTKDFL